MLPNARRQLVARPRLAHPLVLTTLAATTAAAVTAAPLAAADPVSVAASSVRVAPAAGATAAQEVSLGALSLTGTSTNVAVYRVRRSGQVDWINHVLDTRLVNLDRCQARRTPAVWNQHVYRSKVTTVCSDGPARAEAAARELSRSRPWYRVSVTEVPLVGFTLQAALSQGNDRAVPAALAVLPSGDFTFAEGDDVSLNYVGSGVSQRQLDRARAAFAAALGIDVSKVTVTPIAQK